MPCRILVVDDEEPVRELLEDLLKREKYLVETASSGEMAIELVGKERFDMVLLDIKLSGISGLETLRKIKDLKPELAVVMITGFGYDEELIVKSKAYGCSGYVGKNLPASQLMSSFKSFLEDPQGNSLCP